MPEDPDAQLGGIREALHALELAELAEFDHLLFQKLSDAYIWDLWGAAYLINAGCSDDGFFYFRSWLIMQGEDIYRRACASPDSLATLVTPEHIYEFELLWGIALEVYEERTGEPMPDRLLDWPDAPAGERWDFEDSAEAARRLPALAVLYQW